MLQIITKQLYFSYLENILIGKKNNDFGTVGKYSNVVLLVVSAWTADKIRLNYEE